MVVPPLSRLPALSPNSSSNAKAKIRFSLHSLFTITLLGGIVCYAVVSARRGENAISFGAPIDRSWMSGTMAIELESDSTQTTFVLNGDFPDASPGLYLKYDIWLAAEAGEPIIMQGGTMLLEQRFERSSGGWEHAGGNYRRLVGAPIRAILDYEIWEGEPGDGTLLQKTSVLSDPHVISPATNR